MQCAQGTLFRIHPIVGSTTAGRLSAAFDMPPAPRLVVNLSTYLSPWLILYMPLKIIAQLTVKSPMDA